MMEVKQKRSQKEHPSYSTANIEVKKIYDFLRIKSDPTD